MPSRKPLKLSRPLLILALLALIIVLALGAQSAGLISLPSLTSSQFDKTDPNWLKNYCHTQVETFPAPNFTFTKKNPAGYNQPSPYVESLIDKDATHETCQTSFQFDTSPAYASLGVTWGANIKYVNEFEEKVDLYLSEQITKFNQANKTQWEKISPINDQDGGRPGYSYGGFPLIFKRQTRDTLEYLEYSFGANTLYSELTVVVK